MLSTITQAASFAIRAARTGLCLALLLFAVAEPAEAQDAGGDFSVYQVTDVAADATADNASAAREQALKQAQRAAFAQLLERLNVHEDLGARLDDGAVAALVQSFEVQQERLSAVRYLATFTIQFRPLAVQRWLQKHNVAFSEGPPKPLLVLPVLMAQGRPVLWEEKTAWRAAWEEIQPGGTPLALPSGDLADIATLGTADVVGGTPEPLAALIRAYKAGGAVIATLNGDLESPERQPSWTLEVRRADTRGATRFTTRTTIPTAGKTVEALIAEAVQTARDTIANKGQNAAPALPKGPSYHLQVSVRTESLPAWARIRRQILQATPVVRAEMLALRRGDVAIDLEFRGDLDGLRSALSAQGLTLASADGTQGWILVPSGAQP